MCEGWVLKTVGDRTLKMYNYHNIFPLVCNISETLTENK